MNKQLRIPARQMAGARVQHHILYLSYPFKNIAVDRDEEEIKLQYQLQHYLSTEAFGHFLPTTDIHLPSR